MKQWKYKAKPSSIQSFTSLADNQFLMRVVYSSKQGHMGYQLLPDAVHKPQPMRHMGHELVRALP